MEDCSSTGYTGKRKCCDKAEYEVYHEFFKRNLFIVADGKIYSTIFADHEKLTIDIRPVKKNMIPVIYYEDITAILMNYKIPGYYIFFICLAVISCFPILE